MRTKLITDYSIMHHQNQKCGNNASERVRLLWSVVLVWGVVRF
jgi:hypothetical protein